MIISVFDLQQDFFSKIQQSILGPKNNWSHKYIVIFNYLFQSPGHSEGKKIDFTGKVNADISLIFAYRIPEICLMILNPETKFIYVQHGYYTIKMRRTFSGIIKKIDRIIVYFLLFLMVAFRRPKSIIPLLNFIFKVWIKGNGMNGTIAPASPNLALIQGAAWENWHREKIGWQTSTYCIKPYFERKKIQYKYEVGAWQYICQSLVEDGRINQDLIRKSLKDFIKKNKPNKIYFILHPRSNPSIYKDLAVNYEFVTDCIYTLPTLGHYSSLLIYAKQHALNIQLLPLENHEIPTDFRLAIAKPAAELKNYLKYTSTATESFVWQYLNKL